MSERSFFLQNTPRPDLARTLSKIVWALTLIVIGLVVAMRRIKLPLPEGVDLSFLPALNAGLNTLVAVLLIGGLVAALKGALRLHRGLMSTAVITSILFLLSYVAYHITTDETSYGGEGVIRVVYYTILATHVILAAVSFPFILMTLVYALTHQYDKHRTLARRIYPVWLYVAITGPIVYALLKPYYSALPL